jgi:hypothetical protein
LFIFKVVKNTCFAFTFRPFFKSLENAELPSNDFCKLPPAAIGNADEVLATQRCCSLNVLPVFKNPSHLFVLHNPKTLQTKNPLLPKRVAL